jgi:hypothetical protein
MEEGEFMIISRLLRARWVTSKAGFGLKKRDSRLGRSVGVVNRHRQVRSSA